MTVDRIDPAATPGIRALFGRLDELSSLEDDWDSYGGRPPTARAMGAASHLIVEATTHVGKVPSDVMPFPNGGLQVIWELSEREIQVDVGPDGSLGYLTVDRGGGRPEMTESSCASLSDVLALVAQPHRR
jgi:hypothetical protein